ncbi:abortive infection family protein [Streptosporangium sp. NPDC006013]|uniref:abortive infection family protein n=1 Tax=Streptosporangium sp. NPDC006013 TaxID=3155596 RepID=UPI0033A3A00D
MTDLRALVSLGSCTKIRELVSGWGPWEVRDIHDHWQFQGFAPGPSREDVRGERRSLFQAYLDAVDWTDYGQVSRALRVFEDVLRANTPESRAEAVRFLRRDGFQVDDDGSIRSTWSTLREGSLATLDNPSAIYEGVERLRKAIENEDPALVIGCAKELIESTCKVVLREVGEIVDDKAKFPDLTRSAQKALLLVPDRTSHGPDSAEGLRKILGGLTGIAGGLNELRNHGHGTGHGPAQARVGLYTRHARLATGAAILYCQTLLDTLQDPHALWRTRSQVANT